MACPMTTSVDVRSALVSPEAFRRRVERRLHSEALLPVRGYHASSDRHHVGPSDFDLNPDFAQLMVTAAPPRPAAVLVGVVMRSPLTVLLTLRTPHLKAHAGQVAFPGGKVEEHDATATDTALREATEEIGLDKELVEPLGFLDTYRTGTGYAIAPLVALIEPNYAAVLDPNEVAALFEVPLGFLMDPANARLETRHWRGRDRRFYALSFNGYDIWGATAGMLHNMRERLFEE